MIGLDAILAAIVTAEPDQNCLILFSNILSCFSKTTDQNCKSCSPSMHRGENFGFWLHPEPKSHHHPPPPPCHPHTNTEPKDWDVTRTLIPESFQKLWCIPKHKSPLRGGGGLCLQATGTFWCTYPHDQAAGMREDFTYSPDYCVLREKAGGNWEVNKGGEEQKNWEEEQKKSDQDWELWRELLGLTLKVPSPKWWK